MKLKLSTIFSICFILLIVLLLFPQTAKGRDAYTPKTQDWRFSKDDAATPTTFWAAINTAPTGIVQGNVIRLRWTVNETGAGTSLSDAAFKVQYDTTVDFTSPVDIDAQGGGGTWRHYNSSQVTDGGANVFGILTDSDTNGYYHETPWASAGFSHAKSTAQEEDIVIEFNASITQTYYFRMVIAGTAVPLNTSETYPSAQTTTAANPTLNQRSYRWQDDDGANVNSNTNSAVADTSLTMEQGERATIRIQLDNTGAADATSKVYKLQFAARVGGTCDGDESYADVGTATAIAYSSGLAGNNGDAITAEVTDVTSECGDGTCTGFVNGTWHEGVNLTTSQTLTQDFNTEFGFMIETSNATAGENYCLRLYNNTDSVVLNGTYVSYPALTIVASPAKNYSKEAAGSLPSATTDLTYYLDDLGYTYVGTDDNTNRDPITSSANIPISMFKVKNTNNTDDINITWNGQSTVAPSTNTVTLEIYNGASWESVATDSATGADTDFTLSGSRSGTGFYDGSFWVYVRVSQASGTQTLRTDYISVSFGAGTLTQNDWQIYENIDAEPPTTSLGAVNTAVSDIKSSQVVRLRMNVTANTFVWPANKDGFKLQYGERTGADCTSGVTWFDVGAIDSATIWRGYNNASVTDGATVTSLIVTGSETAESYEEANDSVLNPNEIAVGEEGEWDWVVQNRGADALTNYCFKMIFDGGSDLGAYNSDSYPQITTYQTATQKAAEDTAITNVAKNTNIRLRISVDNTGSGSASNYNYRLEFATRVSGTCDTDETYAAVPTSSGSAFIMSASTYFVNGEPTTAQLTAEGTFVAGEMVKDATNQTGNITLTNGQYTEVEYNFQATTTATNEEYYCFRVTNAGTPIDGYDAGKYAQLQITADTGDTLTFALGSNTLVLGTLSSSAVQFNSHTMNVATSASSGMVVTVSGATLTFGGNTIDACASGCSSSTGTEQFGINLKDNATPNVGAEASGSAPIGVAATNYNTADTFRFVTGEVVASSTAGINDTTFTISYIANISGATEAGSYTANLTYIATGTF